MLALERMTSAEVRRVVENGADTVVIPFGSIEEHGGHLPVGSDALLADVVGEAVAARLNALLAPTVRVGCAQRHVGCAGTLSLPAETLRDVALHIGSSLIAHGFRVIALISTHGGNQAALEEAARQLNEHHPGFTACVPRGDVGPTPGSRSGEWLTSVMLSLRPDLVHAQAADPDLMHEVRAASSEDGARNLERFVSAIVRAVGEIAQP